MARRRRLLAGGETHHLIQRGNDRMAIFFEDLDRRLYLNWLAEAARARGVLLHAYVLMSNHVHLLLTAPHAVSLPRLMQSLGRRYVSHVNRSHRRTGTLWEGRYRSTLLDSDGYVLTCHRYIEANPLRARMVASATDYPWSSFRHNALGESDPLLSDHPVYAGLGPTSEARRTAYRALFEDRIDEELVASIRDATQRGWVPGSERFRNEIAAMHGRRSVEAPRRGRPPKPKPITSEPEILLPL
jgi:putative transposase